MPMCLLCIIIRTNTFLKTCSTKSLSIHNAIHLHFPTWFSDRGFHQVSLLVYEATQRNNPPLWEMHQSLNLCPTLTAQQGDNGDVGMSLSPSCVSPAGAVSQEVIKIRGWIHDSSNTCLNGCQNLPPTYEGGRAIRANPEQRQVLGHPKWEKKHLGVIL